MKLLLKMAFVALIFCSCGGNGDVKKRLGEIESYLGGRPYDAIVALQEIGDSELSSAKLRAKHSLMLSMAMEQMYLEQEDLSLPLAALEYYSRKGTATERLRSYYYCGKAYLAGGDTEMAMECFVKGLGEGNGSDDTLTIAKLHYEKGLIHKTFYEWEKCILETSAASALFRELQDNSLRFNALTNAFQGYMALDNASGAKKVLHELETVADNTNAAQASVLHELRMLYEAKYGSVQSVRETIPQYLAQVPESYVNWLSVAEVLLQIGQKEQAMEAVMKYGTYSMDKPMNYWLTASKAYEALGYKDEALVHYRRYAEMSDSTDMTLLANDARFIEERYALQIETMEKQAQKRNLIICGLCFVLVLMGIIAYAVYRLRLGNIENMLYRTQCEQLEREKSELADVMESSWVIKGPVKDIIKERLELLNTIMAASISENDKIDRTAQQKIEKFLEDRKSFMNSTVAAFEASHPAFISHLRERGLTDMELGYCCLYAIGLNGKNVGGYTRMSRHYIINSEIRKKLSLEEKSANLDKYIQQLLQA